MPKTRMPDGRRGKKLLAGAHSPQPFISSTVPPSSHRLSTYTKRVPYLNSSLPLPRSGLDTSTYQGKSIAYWPEAIATER